MIAQEFDIGVRFIADTHRYYGTIEDLHIDTVYVNGQSFSLPDIETRWGKEFAQKLSLFLEEGLMEDSWGE